MHQQDSEHVVLVFAAIFYIGPSCDVGTIPSKALDQSMLMAIAFTAYKTPFFYCVAVAGMKLSGILVWC